MKWTVAGWLTLSLLTSSLCRGEVVFLRRTAGSQDFYQGWEDYQEGFVDPTGEFWLGLERLYDLEAEDIDRYKLRIDMVRATGERVWAEYSYFSGEDEELFPLTVMGYNQGPAAETEEDPVTFNTLMPYSTFDKYSYNRCWFNCASKWLGEACNRQCSDANPTGVYSRDWGSNTTDVTWYLDYNKWYTFKEMTFTLVET